MTETQKEDLKKGTEVLWRGQKATVLKRRGCVVWIAVYDTVETVFFRYLEILK